MESVVKKHLTFQKLSITHCQPFPGLLWAKSPASVWQEVIGIWVWACFWAKSFEALLVLECGITMNFVIDHFPNEHISCSETFHLPLWLHQHCNHLPRNTFHLQWKALLVPLIERGLKEMSLLLQSWVRTLHHQHSWSFLIWGLDLFYKKHRWQLL